MPKINRDQLNNADAAHAARAGFAILDRLQNAPQHIQAIAAAAVFLVLSEHLRIPAQDLFNVTKNMLNEEDTNEHFNALRDYVKYEVKR